MMIAFRTVVSRNSDRRWNTERSPALQEVQRMRPARNAARVREQEAPRPIVTEAPHLEDLYEEPERWDGMS